MTSLACIRYQALTRHRDIKCNYSTQDNEQKPSGPLSGLRVLDLTRILAGPFCTQILADYGATVIKVEQPGTGDDTRHWKSAAESSGEGFKWKTESPMSLYFSAVNRNKRSVTLDLKKAEGKEALYKLVERSDVFVENFVPGKAEELGVGYDSLSKLNTKLIYGSISGYGASGPFAKRAGYDGIAAAEGGLMHITGEPEGKPVRPGLGMVDMSTGLYMHGAILAALRERDRTGKGQKIDASLFETQISLLINIGMNWLNLGLEGQRYGSAHPSIVPYNTFKTKDGHFALGANNDRQFKTLAHRIGRRDLLDDERFSTNPRRVGNREHVEQFLNELLLTKSNKQWAEVFEGSGLPYGPVNSVEEAFSHPQIEPRRMIRSVKSVATEGGTVEVIGLPVKFSESHPEVRAGAPMLGEHTLDTLRDIGYSEVDIGKLREAKAI